jgi:hypothetical protein
VQLRRGDWQITIASRVSSFGVPSKQLSMTKEDADAR